jgi:two-component system, NtrC family, nitrogen regulation sensor histidine kinase NtrY
MASKLVSFTSAIILRAVCIALSGVVLALVSFPEPRWATMALIIFLIAFLIAQIVSICKSSYMATTRLADAIGHSDFQVRFNSQWRGEQPEALNHAIDNALKRFSAQHETNCGQLSYFKQLVEFSPIALFEFDRKSQPAALNRAAREMEANVDQLATVLGEHISSATPLLPSAHRGLKLKHQQGFEFSVKLSSVQGHWQGRAIIWLFVQSIEQEIYQNENELSISLLRVVSHELMNSLTPIMSLAQSAQASQSEIQVREALRIIARRTEGLSDFVQRYRQITQLPKPRLQPVNIEQLLKQLIVLSKAQYPFINWTMTQQGNNWVYFLDEQLIEQALINLVRNAAQALEQSSISTSEKSICIRLKLETTHRGQSNFESVEGQACSQLVIDVDDNGPGVTSDLQRDIFLPLFSTKSKGRGIGLKLARQIAQAHGGDLRLVASQLGGACFRMTLGVRIQA